MRDRRRASDDLERVVDTDTCELPHGLGRVDVRRVDEVGRAESTGERQLLRIGVDRHDPGGTGDASALDHVEPDAAAPDHGDRVAGLDMGDVEDGTQAGDDGAAEDRRQLDRHVARYRDYAPFVHQHPLGEPTDPTHRGDGAAVGGGEPGAFAGGPSDRLRVAALAGLAAMARRAPTASSEQAGDDRVAHRHRADRRADRLDDPCRFVAEHLRARPDERPVQAVEVAVTEPARLDPDEDLARTGRVVLDDVDDEVVSAVVEDRGPHFARYQAARSSTKSNVVANSPLSSGANVAIRLSRTPNTASSWR